MDSNNLQPSEKFGPAPIDSFKPVDPVEHLPAALEVKSEDEKRQLLDGVLKAAEEKRRAGDIAGALKEIMKFAKPFLPLP